MVAKWIASHFKLHEIHGNFSSADCRIKVPTCRLNKRTLFEAILAVNEEIATILALFFQSIATTAENSILLKQLTLISLLFIINHCEHWTLYLLHIIRNYLNIIIADVNFTIIDSRLLRFIRTICKWMIAGWVHPGSVLLLFTHGKISSRYRCPCCF